MDGTAGNPRLASAAGPSSDLAATIYGQLRAIAQVQMNSERAGHTLTATALVHEAYLRLSNSPLGVAGGGAGAGSAEAGTGGGPGRAQFLHAAAEAMRRILIEHARARGRVKRGGRLPRVSLDAIGDVADLASDDQGDNIVAFDEALRRLEEHDGADGRLAQVVRLRFFAGLSVAETAAVLGVSERTVNNDWSYARAWLARELQREPAEPPTGGRDA